MNVLPLGKKMTIDVDNTVADCSAIDWGKVDSSPSELLKAQPIKGALEAVKKLYQEGHTIVFYTSRSASWREVTKKWLKIHGFPFHHIEMEKLVAHIYIDDRAISGQNWEDTLEELQNPHLPGRMARENGHI